MIHRAARCSERTGDLAVPRIRVLLAVERLQQGKVDRQELQIDVLHNQHRAADPVRHGAADVRAVAARVDIRDCIIENAKIALILDVQVHRAATGTWQRLEYPGDVVHRHRVAVDPDVVSNRQIVAPVHFAFCTRHGAGEFQMGEVNPNGIAPPECAASHVSPSERR